MAVMAQQLANSLIAKSTKVQPTLIGQAIWLRSTIASFSSSATTISKDSKYNRCKHSNNEHD